jgi:pheromone shutdown protein TraB
MTVAWGEDALLKWPGAVTPLIEERDAYMARVMAAAAQGSNPNVPAYVADQVC